MLATHVLCFLLPQGVEAQQFTAVAHPYSIGVICMVSAVPVAVAWRCVRALPEMCAPLVLLPADAAGRCCWACRCSMRLLGVVFMLLAGRER